MTKDDLRLDNVGYCVVSRTHVWHNATRNISKGRASFVTALDQAGDLHVPKKSIERDNSSTRSANNGPI